MAPLTWLAMSAAISGSPLVLHRPSHLFCRPDHILTAWQLGSERPLLPRPRNRSVSLLQSIDLKSRKTRQDSAEGCGRHLLIREMAKSHTAERHVGW